MAGFSVRWSRVASTAVAFFVLVYVIGGSYSYKQLSGLPARYYERYRSPHRQDKFGGVLQPFLDKVSDTPWQPDTTILSNVWQLFLGPDDLDPTKVHQQAVKDSRVPADLAATWFPVDGKWQYNFIGSGSAESFVRSRFKQHSDIIRTFTSITRPVVRSDFMRYLLVLGEGGVYSDTDVVLVKPLQWWIPEEYLSRTRAVIGIEYDQRDDTKPQNRRFEVSFAQYVFAAAKGHPIVRNMVQNIIDIIVEFAETQGKEIGNLTFSDQDVLDVTGPRAFTQIVYDHLSQSVGQTVTWRNVTKIGKPKLIGDTLIMPINSFGAGQTHSGSDDNSPDKLVRHVFMGRWRGGKDGND